MAKEAGVVKSLSGKAVAVDQNGNERELKVGDIVYMGESVKTSDAADKVTIVANNGKELTVLGSDTLSLNPNTIGAEGLADISALQNAILNGGDLTKLEETAAGGNAAAGGGDGVSLGEARFAEGGHYSNINETYRNLTDTNRAFASYDSPIGGYSDGNANGGDLIPPKPSVSVEFTEDKNNDGFLTYTENFDNNASSHDLNTSPVKITVANVVPGDILHVTLTKPDGTVTPLSPITINATDIVNNTFTKIISDMPVAEGKISKVDAYVTDSANPNTIKSNEASDSVTPYERPTIRFTEDKNDNGFLTDAENKGEDENFRTSPVEVTLPKDLAVGDKIIITYTDPLNPTGPKLKLDPIELTNEMITNHKVTGYELPIFPGVKTETSVHVVGKDGSQKTGESSPDSVTPQTIKMDMNLPEQQTLREISRQESVSNYKDTYNGVEIDLGDQKVNHTTAKITLPNRIDDGDKLTLHVTKPDGTTYDRNFTIHMNEKGVIESVDEVDSAGSVIGRYNTSNKNFFKEDTNQWAIKVDGFELENGKDTKIEAKVTHPTHPTNPYLPTEVDSESASLEYVKAPEVIFDEADGAKTMTREQAISDKKINNDLNNDLNSTMVTIKLPKNAVNGDKLTVTIKEPDGKNPDGTTKFHEYPKHYTVEKDATGKLVGIKNDDDPSDHVTIKNGNSFEIPNIKTATGVKTEVNAEITDSDGSIQHATGSSSVTIAGINDMAVRFVEDGDSNVSLTRSESKDGDNDLLKTTIAVKVPNNVIAGDIVTVKIDNGTSPKIYEVTGRDPSGKIILEDKSTHTSITASDKNEIEIKDVQIEAGKTINVSAETTDASGGKKAEAQNHNTLEKLHNDMKITFEEDADNDGILYNSEANSDHNETTTTATIKLPSNFVVGDKLVIESYNEDAPNNKTIKKYTISKDAGGNLVAKDGSETLNIVDDPNGNKIVKYTLNLTEDHTTIINAKVTDDTGVDKVGTKSDIMLDAQGAGTGTRFRLLIDEDKDRNGVLDREEAMTDHQLNTTSATLQIPTSVKVGDTITVSVNGGSPKTYKVASNDGTNVTIKDAVTGTPVALETGTNKLKIDGVSIKENSPAKVDVVIRDHVTGEEKKATAEAKLETFDATNLKVEFKEDNASRDGKIDRDEAVSDGDVTLTTISVQVPYNVIDGDKIEVKINQPGDTTPRIESFKVVKDASGNISLDHNGASYPFTNNTFEIHDVKMLPGKETTATAKITNAAGDDDMSATSKEAKAQLAPLSEAGLNISIAADKNDNGIITRDESDSNTSKVKVSLPGNVIKGDKIDVEVTNPDNSKVIKHYEVDSKDVNGNITLKDVTDSNNPFIIVDENNNPKKFNVSNPLELDAAVAVGIDTVAKVTLTDAFNNSVSTEDKAHAEIDVVRGIQFTEDASRDGALQTYENSQNEDKTPIKVYLNEDARAGDIVEIKYTDPDNHTQTKPANHILTADDIKEGAFEQVLDINPISKYDIKVDATYKTHDGLETKLPVETLSILPKAVTAEYDEHTTMKGGDNSDTLIVDGQTVDFSHVTGLDAKVESFENIQLKGNSEIKFDANAIFDITDNLNTVLKIKGAVDEHGNSTTKIDLDHKWDPDSNYDAGGFKGYSSKDQVDGQTIHIQIDDKVQTDL